LNIFVAGVSYAFLESLGYKLSSGGNTFSGIWGMILTLLLVAVLPAFGEEITHRGMLLSAFRTRFPVKRAIVMVALLFGLVHLNIQQFFYAAVLGWYLSMSVVVSGSIWSAVIIHFTNNAISVYMGFAKELNLYDPFSLFLNNAFSFIILVVLAYVLTGMILKYMDKRRIKNNAIIVTPNLVIPKTTIRERVWIFSLYFVGAVMTLYTLYRGIYG
jgi:membrane protease YdiL (CAAX protease family)